ncbi:hypothetical protein D3C86_1628510 [compost metagenome]
MSTKTIDSEIVGYLPLLGEGEKKPLLGIIEAYNIRVTYFMDDINQQVNIIRVRSIRQEPLTY